MKKLLFLLLICNVHLVYGQLVVDSYGNVKLHYPIPENYYTDENVSAYFGGNIIVSGIVYHDIATGIDRNQIRNFAFRNSMSPIETCMQLCKLLSPMDDETAINRHHIIDSLQKNDSLIILAKENGGIAINYTELVPILVSAISDMQNEINMLRKRLNSETDKH